MPRTKMISDDEPLLPVLEVDEAGVKTENMPSWIQKMNECLVKDLSGLDPER